MHREVRILSEVYYLEEAYVKIKEDEFIYFKSKIDEAIDDMLGEIESE